MSIKSACLFFALAPTFLLGQVSISWSDSIVISATSLAVTAPRIELLGDGTPMVTWGTSGTPAQIWCARFDGSAFDTPTGVVPASSAPNLFGFGGYDVAVADSLVFVVFERLQNGILCTRSGDGGLTFSPPVMVQGPVASGYATLSAVTIDGTGNPIVSYIRDKDGATYEVRRSPDGGLHFGEPVQANAAAPGGKVCECCTADMVASEDSIWIVFRNNNLNLRDIWVSRSIDTAATFDVATDVDDTDWMLNVCPISGPSIARAGDSLVTAWMSKASGVARVYLSTLHAGTMASGQQLDFPPILPQTGQDVADVTAYGDTIGLVFVEKSKELVFYYSVDGAQGLPGHSTRFAVPNHTLQYPTLTYRNGVFHLVYMDNTSDKLLYRRGVLTQSSAVSEPVDGHLAQVFPNPTTGKAIIAATGNAVMFFDLHGRLVHTEEGMNIDVGALSAGVYFFYFWENGHRRQGKIVKI